MAAPDDMTMENINGKWLLNKTLSDSIDGTLALQSVPILFRQLSKVAVLESEITTEPEPISSDDSSDIASSTSSSIRLTITSTLSSVGYWAFYSLRALGITPSTIESRLLDGQEFEKEDRVVGTVVGRMWLCGIDDELDFAFSDHFEQEDVTFLKGISGVKAEDKILRMSLWSKDQESPMAWRAEHLWGFEDVEEGSTETTEESSARRYARRIVVKKGEEVERARMVYDFLGMS